MQQLSGQDASFLYLETATAPMHVGAITIYDQKTVAGGVQSFKAILAQIERRLHLARTFRQRLARVPLGLDHPYWIQDDEFDLEFHVRHISLPRPGDWRQLCIQAARLHARPLDLTKPLWEFTIIEGLDDIEGLPRGCYAVISKVHHAANDGVSGFDISEALHDLIPEGAPIAPPEVSWHGEPEPSAASLLGRACLNSVRGPLRAAAVAARTVPAVARLAGGYLSADLRGAGAVPATRFNRGISPHRVVEGRIFDLDELKAIQPAAAGATTDDVVLAICGGALRRYLLDKDELPQVSMIAMAPLAVREERSAGAHRNRAAAMNVALGTHIADPLERLRFVTDSARRSRARINALGARLLTDFTQFIPSTVSGLAARLYSRLGMANRHDPFFNCVVTSVPGPQVPQYANRARMLTQFGLGPLFDGMGIMFPVFSYAGHLTISFTACREMVPDPERLAGFLQQEFDVLHGAATGETRGSGADFGAALAQAMVKVEVIARCLAARQEASGSAAAQDSAPDSVLGSAAVLESAPTARAADVIAISVPEQVPEREAEAESEPESEPGGGQAVRSPEISADSRALAQPAGAATGPQPEVRTRATGGARSRLAASRRRPSTRRRRVHRANSASVKPAPDAWGSGRGRGGQRPRRPTLRSAAMRAARRGDAARRQRPRRRGRGLIPWASRLQPES